MSNHKGPRIESTKRSFHMSNHKGPRTESPPKKAFKSVTTKGVELKGQNEAFKGVII